MSGEAEKDFLRVLAVHGKSLDRNLATANATATTADAAIGDAERLLARLGKSLPIEKSSSAPHSRRGYLGFALGKR